MQALIDVILPVFLVIGFGYVARWSGVLTDATVDSLMKFAQTFAIPCLLFLAISGLDLARDFDPALLLSFYSGAVASFAAGLFGARLLFSRPWEDSVAIGFSCLFANSVLLGLPITERAYGPESLGPNYAIISLYAPFCYMLGITVMESVRARGKGAAAAMRSVALSMARNALVIGIALGFAVNLAEIPLPGLLQEALEMMRRAALPVALFALGGVLYRYRPEGDAATIAFVCAVSLVLHPAITWTIGGAVGLSDGQFRSAVLTAAMAPGVNSYLFANMYGVARRVAASTVLLATGLSILSVSVWLTLLP